MKERSTESHVREVSELNGKANSVQKTQIAFNRKITMNHNEFIKISEVKAMLEDLIVPLMEAAKAREED